MVYPAFIQNWGFKQLKKPIFPMINGTALLYMTTYSTTCIAFLCFKWSLFIIIIITVPSSLYIQNHQVTDLECVYKEWTHYSHIAIHFLPSTLTLLYHRHDYVRQFSWKCKQYDNTLLFRLHFFLIYNVDIIFGDKNFKLLQSPKLS